MHSLSHRHALITGGSRGIGAAIASKLANAGARVTIVGRTPTDLEASAARISAESGALVIAVAADVTDPTSLDAAFERAREAHGCIDILVNNAGAARSAPFLRTDDALWREMIGVNLESVYQCSRRAIPAMIEGGWGRIVNVASTAGLVGYRYVSAYCAAKHGVIGLTRAIALELAGKGVTVNALCPGYTNTPLLDATIANIVAKTGRSSDEARAQLAAGNPMRRLIEVDEIADAVAWLCSEGARSVTGQAIPIDGGEVMR